MFEQKRAYWRSLDNAAKLFSAASSPKDTRVFRFYCELKEEVKEEEKGIDIEPKDEITFEEFGKMQFQVGEIISCEAVKKSKKLLKCTLQMGGEERIVLSGIKKWYSPEQLIGKTVVVAANLAPKTICGIESHGMILCASDASDENLSALTTMGDMASGLKVR